MGPCRRLVFFSLVCAVFLLAPGSSRAGDGIGYELYVPSTTTGALVVMLHGCDQTAADFAAITKMNSIADRVGFSVLYPEQNVSRNVARCWNWFAQPKGAFSEASMILAIVEDVQTEEGLNGPVFVAGLSAGGAMAGVLGTCHSDTVQAVAIHSSVSFLRASDAATGLALMATGLGHPLNPGAKCDGFAQVPALVVQGSADTVVSPANAASVHSDLGVKLGSAILSVPGLPHAWSGGTDGFKYSFPDSVDASELVWAFFAANAN